MEYNSQKDLLVILEYGRSIQELIRHTFTVEDRDERQAYLEKVINLMQQMHPQSRNVADSKIKLWQHAVRIAGGDLDVQYPEGLSPELKPKLPDQVHYPEEVRRFRHYGKNVHAMITKAAGMEEGPVRDGFVRTIASYMKMAYHNWHREIMVNDEVIKSDLTAMSEGKLSIPADELIDASGGGVVSQNVKMPPKKRVSGNTTGNSIGKSGKYKKSNTSGYRNKNRRRK